MAYLEAGPPPVTADIAAAYVRRIFDITCTEPTIRQWARRHPDLIHDHGWSGRRRLYDLDEIHAVAAIYEPLREDHLTSC